MDTYTPQGRRAVCLLFFTVAAMLVALAGALYLVPLLQQIFIGLMIFSVLGGAVASIAIGVLAAMGKIEVDLDL